MGVSSVNPAGVFPAGPDAGFSAPVRTSDPTNKPTDVTPELAPQTVN
jgi:hypothetical protein